MRQQINFYRRYRNSRRLQFGGRSLLWAVAALLLGVVLLQLLNLWQLSRLRGGIAEADSYYAEASKRFQTISQTVAGRPRDRALEQQVAQLEKVIARRHQLKSLLGQGRFSNKEGFSSYFIALSRQHVDGLWLGAVRITGAADSVTLSGRVIKADLLPRYLEGLSRESVLSGINFRIFRLLRPEPDSARPPEDIKAIDFTVTTEQYGKSAVGAGSSRLAEVRP